MGDCCPHFQELIDSGYLEAIKQEQLQKGNLVHYFNREERGGGCGYALINHAIQNATGKYFIFYGNDDMILPDHFKNYLEIEQEDLDFMFFETWVDPISQPRPVVVQNSMIGHSEIIVRTSLARGLTPHNDRYGHDWDFIEEMIHKGKGKTSESQLRTYRVMHVPSYGTKDTID